MVPYQTARRRTRLSQFWCPKECMLVPSSFHSFFDQLQLALYGKTNPIGFIHVAGFAQERNDRKFCTVHSSSTPMLIFDYGSHRNHRDFADLDGYIRE